LNGVTVDAKSRR